MKTLLSILSILALSMIIPWIDAGHLDAGVCFMALAVAGLSGMALNDGGRRPAHLRLRLA